MAVSGLRRALASKLTIGIGGVLALGVGFVQTALDAMPKTSLPSADIRKPIEAGRWRVAILEADVSTGPRPDGYRGRPGTKALAVDVELENRTSASSNVFSRVLKVDPPIEGLSPLPTAYLMRDGAILGAIQPGLPERVRMVWDVPETASVPHTLSVVVVGETFKPRDNLFAAPGWFDPKPIARVSLQVNGSHEGDGP